MSVKVSDKITVPIETVEKMYKAIAKTGAKEVSFEYIVGSCFPKAMDNIREEMHRQYTKGFADGIKEKTQ